jgi:hypothetical protein
MAIQVRNGGAWDPIDGTQKIYGRSGGAWVQASRAHRFNGSTWEQVYQYDNTGPSVGNWSVTGNNDNTMTFSWSGGALVTDADSGVVSVQVKYQYTPWGGSGEGWNNWLSWSTSEWSASSGSYSFTPPTAKRPTQGGSLFAWTITNRYYVDFQVTATDAAGNSTVKTIANGQLTRPYGTFYIDPSTADSYQLTAAGANIAFYGLSAPAVRSGNAISAGGLNWAYGCWFYGDEVENYHLVRDGSGNRYKADSGTLYIQRYQDQGTSGAWAFQQHNLRFSNGATGATFVGNTLVASPNISGTDADRTFTLDSGHLDNFSTLAAKGFGMVRNGSSSYRVARNFFQDFSASGRVTVVFN